jgi:hypothetical protein
MKIVLDIIIILIFLFIFSHVFFRSFKWYRYIACHVMPWHSYPDFEHISNDGCSDHARCKWCGYEGMIDSQGNLF